MQFQVMGRRWCQRMEWNWQPMTTRRYRCEMSTHIKEVIMQRSGTGRSLLKHPDSVYALALALQENDVYIAGENSIPSTTRSEMSTDSDLAFALALQNDDDVYITSIEEGSSTASTARSTDSDFAFALELQETDTFVTDVDKISPMKTESKDRDFAYRDDDDDDDVCITGVVNMPPRAKVKAEPLIDDDFALALSIQDENKYKIEAPKKANSGSSLKQIPITDTELENVDPVPDVRSLFLRCGTVSENQTILGITNINESAVDPLRRSRNHRSTKKSKG